MKKKISSVGTGGFLNPEKVIKDFNIKKGMEIADFGCGAGYFTIPIAESVGKNGKVYAFDVLRTALESVRSKARVNGLENIELIRTNLELPNGSGLNNSSVDIVLMANILFQSPKKSAILKEAGRILKKGGRLIVIDWKNDQPMGPPKKFIVSKDLVKNLAEKKGLKFDREIPAGNRHWGIIFIKN